MQALWWAANVVLVLAAIPLVVEAARIIASLNVVHGAATDIRDAAVSIARDLPGAVGAAEEAADVSDRAASSLRSGRRSGPVRLAG
ncbi:MAG: hypothetical protein V7605_881 [Acidimicrobiaceae bacterium]